MVRQGAGEAGRRERADSLVYCLVPRHLPSRVERDLRDAFADTRVIVERRRSDRRRRGDRRSHPAQCARADERRRVHSRDGRRVGPRRARVTVVPAPGELPAAARPQARSLRFVERRAMPLRDVEDLDTARLVIGLQSGQAGAFDEIYERYIARVYGYLRVALRDEHEAEDVAHEVFVSLLKALPRFEVRDTPFRVWLFRIVRNQALNHLRRHSRMDVMDPAEVTRRLEADPLVEGGEDLLDLRDGELLRLIECLSLLQRQVVVLRCVMGFNLADAATILGRSPNAVSQLQRRALTILHDRLVAAGRGPERREARLPMRMPLRDALVTGQRRLALTY